MKLKRVNVKTFNIYNMKNSISWKYTDGNIEFLIWIIVNFQVKYKVYNEISFCQDENRYSITSSSSI